MQEVQLSNGTTLQFPDEMTQDQIKSVIQKKFPPINVSNAPQETSAIQKLTRPLDILYGDVQNALPNIVKLIKEGGPGLLKNAAPSPEMAKDVGAGGVGLFRNILNIPHDVPGLLEHFEMIKPETAKNVEQYLPKFEEQEWVKKLLGEAKTPESKLRRALVENAPLNLAALKTALGATKAISKVRPPAALRKIDYEKVMSEIKNVHDLRDVLSSHQFNVISQVAKERGIKNIPKVDSIIDEISKGKYLSKTPENERLLNLARSGDYDALRDLQSDLGKMAMTAKSKSTMSAHRKGEEMVSMRKRINDAIYDHFEDLGYHDLSSRLKTAMDDYHDFMKTYYPERKKSTPGTRKIAEMVNPEKQLVPENPEKVFLEKSKPMNEFIEKHPKIKEALGVASKKKEQLKKMSPFKLPSAVAAGETGKYLLEKLIKGIF